MPIAFTKLPGLDQEKILALVEPVLATHRVDGVELIFRGDKDGKLLLLSIEKPETKRTGEGITIDLCTDISREVSEKLDETDLIPGNYRLEVGSPGVERTLYLPSDYERFSGQEAKLKLYEASEEEGFIGQKTIRGMLFGLADQGRVRMQTDHGTLPFAMSAIESAHLVFTWGQPARPRKNPPRKGAARDDVSLKNASDPDGGANNDSSEKGSSPSDAQSRTKKRSSNNGRR